jgi:DNA polymerase-3 subunit alpha
MVYQEQVMRIASALAGFTLGEADILRKAMGKKKADVMATQMDKFLSGCGRAGIPEKKARKIWDHMEQFAGYGFNKSHSAAYAWLAYQTAYLKANYPAYFMAALLTSERANTDKMVVYIGECREMGIRVLPPDVNQSDIFFTVVGNDIRFGLAAIKNVARGRSRPCCGRARRDRSSRSRFCERVDLRAVNRRVVESFIKSGSLRYPRPAAGRRCSRPSTAPWSPG